MFTAIILLTITAMIAYLYGCDEKINAYENRIEHLISEVRRLQVVRSREFMERKRIPAMTFKRDYVWAQEDRDMEFFEDTTWIEE